MNTGDFTISHYIPVAMKDRKSWVLWSLKANDAGKLRKVPFRVLDGRMASSQEPKGWSDYETAAHVALKSSQYRGLGFMLGGSDLVFIDLDHAIDEAGEFNEAASYVMDKLRSSAFCELSQSGNGLHFFCNGVIPRSFRNEAAGVEMYSGSGHYAAMTGQAVLAQEPGEDPAALRCIFNRFKTKTSEATALFSATHGDGSLDDDAVIRKAAEAPKSGENFKALFSGDWSGYSSQSEADLRLCQLLAFWCDRNPAQIDRIFRSSGLYRRKWEREGYLRRTIERACSGQIGLSEWIQEREQEKRRRLVEGYERLRNQF